VESEKGTRRNVEKAENLGGRRELRRYIFGGGWGTSIILLSFRALPACPSEKDVKKMKFSGLYRMEF
jgi:hypothetical protein